MQALSGTIRLQPLSSASIFHTDSSRRRLPSTRTTTSRRHPQASIRAVSEKESGSKFSKLATDVASSLRGIAARTERALQRLPSKEELAQQTEQTTAELKVQAEQLRSQALQASANLNSILGHAGDDLRHTNEALVQTVEQLRSQTLTATQKLTRLLEEAEAARPKLLAAARSAPEPIKDIAETAVVAHSAEKARKGAVIHDFCLGITFGGLLVAGGLLWFLVSGSVNALRFGVLLGGIMLAAAVGSMNAWKAGQPSTKYIAVQGVAAYLLFARGSARYSQTGAVFPTLIVSVLSIAMCAFYIYVVLSGGNPPPKEKAA